MTMNDKEKTYQDGLNGQQHNGRSWDQYSAGQLMARDMARNKTATSVDFTPKCNISTGGGGGGNIIILAIVVIVALIGLAVTSTSALVAIVVVPLLNIALRKLGLPSSRLQRLYTAPCRLAERRVWTRGAS